jgi:regulator of replication initiation timing
MEETLKILVEYLLEKQTALEMENKRLTQQLQKAEDLKDQFYDGYSKQAEQLAEIARLIRPHLEWKNGKFYALHIYADEGLLEIIKILRITKEDIK